MTAKPRIRTILADDERPARSYLRELLDACDDVEIVGEATNGAEAVVLIERECPDLALLDLQMPELGGLDVVRMLPADRIPTVAFITAYDAYAVQAFNVNAVDYLLKPVELERLRETISRVRARMDDQQDTTNSPARILEAVHTIGQHAAYSPLYRIPVRRRDDIFFILVEDIASVVADGDILNLTTRKGERFLISYTLKELESRLDPEHFFRISRSALVNMNAVAKVSPMPGGTYVVELVNRQMLPVSRQRSKLLRDTVLRL